MGATLPRHYLFGIIVFTFIIVGGMSIMSIFDDADSSFASDNPKFEKFNSSFNKYNEVNEKISALQTGVESEEGSGTFGDFGVLNSLILKGWTSLSLLGSSFSFMNGVFNSLSTIFGVPVWIPSLIILVISIIVVFSIFSAVFQREV